MLEKKTNLLSLSIQVWRKVKSETDKVNVLLTNISTNDITELNHAGTKIVCEKFRVSLKATDRKSKIRCELRLESQIKKKENLRQQAKILKRNFKIYSDETEKERQLERKIKLEETKQKIQAKEGKLKDTKSETNNTHKTGRSKTIKENSTDK